jgi:hypothetical protein
MSNTLNIYKRSFVTLFIMFFLSAINIIYANSGEEPEVKRDRKYIGSALYGFMNGGSDLYLEYGFRELRALDVLYKGEMFTIEIYTMPTPEDAFGIYSLHTFSYKYADTIQRFDCHSRNNLQTVAGNNYISIVFERGCEGINMKAVELLDYYSRDFEKTPVIVPEIVANIARPASGVLKYLKGPLAIMNSFGELDNIVSGIGSFRMWINKESTTEKRIATLFYNDTKISGLIKERVSATKIIASGKDYFVFEF